jgi:hypothetical protein
MANPWVGAVVGTVGAVATTADNVVHFLGGGIAGNSDMAAAAADSLLNKDRDATITTVMIVGSLAARPVAGPDPWQRNPLSLQDQMTLDAARGGAGTRIIKDLKDPRYRGMEQWEYKVKSQQGKDSVVHYVRDPSEGTLMDFKFKKSTTDTPQGTWEKTPFPASTGPGTPPSWWPFSF